MLICQDSCRNINIVVKLSFSSEFENSIITAFRISNKSVKRLARKHKILTQIEKDVL